MTNLEKRRKIEMLRYEARHYQTVGKGSMAQAINAEIRRLLIDEKAN